MHGANYSCVWVGIPTTEDMIATVYVPPEGAANVTTMKFRGEATCCHYAPDSDQVAVGASSRVVTFNHGRPSLFQTIPTVKSYIYAVRWSTRVRLLCY